MVRVLEAYTERVAVGVLCNVQSERAEATDSYDQPRVHQLDAD
jgi:hypothetical protein